MLIEEFVNLVEFSSCRNCYRWDRPNHNCGGNIRPFFLNCYGEKYPLSEMTQFDIFKIMDTLIDSFYKLNVKFLPSSINDLENYKHVLAVQISHTNKSPEYTRHYGVCVSQLYRYVVDFYYLTNKSKLIRDAIKYYWIGKFSKYLQE